MSRTPIQLSSGRGAWLVDVRDVRRDPSGTPTRPCANPGCPGLMRPQGLHVPPMRARGPARSYIPSRGRTLVVWTCDACGRQTR